MGLNEQGAHHRRLDVQIALQDDLDGADQLGATHEREPAFDRHEARQFQHGLASANQRILHLVRHTIKQLGSDVGDVVQAVAGILGTLMTIYGRARATAPLVRREMNVRL